LNLLEIILNKQTQYCFIDEQDLMNNSPASEDIIKLAQSLRWEVGDELHDNLMNSLYADAGKIKDKVVSLSGTKKRFSWERTLDKILTSPLTGFPVMLIILTAIFWITIEGANYPSSMLSEFLIDFLHPEIKSLFISMGAPAWLTGMLVDGVYLASVWVIAVMLPPMAIFFPIFTLLEDFGYLPRIAFNLDNLFRKSGAHGKQALTMSMGYGCNAAGIVATRIIDSPRERLIAIITNNFSLCNGRWPTQILIASLFIGAIATPALAGFVSAMAVVSVALLGIFFTFLISWTLSKTILKGEASTFSLELPPYRPPQVWRTIYTSIIDRTLIVLWRAVVFAMPAGAAIWLLANITIGDLSIAEHIIQFLDTFGWLIGLNGVILLAYIIAIPANEIVVPVILMLTVLSLNISGMGDGAGVMFELTDENAYKSLFSQANWSLLTAINLMLFSLLHNPCSTTIFTIYKETRSAKWTWFSALMPVALGIIVTFFVAQIWRILGWAG
jgi:ferrous iron transport protein B